MSLRSREELRRLVRELEAEPDSTIVWNRLTEETSYDLCGMVEFAKGNLRIKILQRIRITD